MRFGPIEIGPDCVGFQIIPAFFKHSDVSFDEENFADEVGVFWLGLRVSIFYNLMSWAELQERRRQK